MTDNEREWQPKLERLKHLYGLEYEMIRATAAFEHAAIRPLFLLNGGALVVYLGLYGALYKNGVQNGVDLAVGKFAIWLWVAGLVLATLTVFFGAKSQFAFRKCRGQDVVGAEVGLGLNCSSKCEALKASGKYGGQGECYRTLAVVTGVLSLLSFTAGFWPAFVSIS